MNNSIAQEKPTALKPCQWCAVETGEPNLLPEIMTKAMAINGFEAYVLCNYCSANGPSVQCKTEEDARERAAKAWNHRPIEQELVEALEDAIEDVDEFETEWNKAARALVKKAKAKA